MPINQRRPDTPLANTPEPRFVQDTIKPKVMTYAEKRAAQQLVREKNIRARDSVLNRNAAAKGMTREEVRSQQEKDKNKPNAQLEGLEIGKACKRTDKKGSCTTGQTGGGQSLKDTK
jgi:hypothetical protein